MENLLEMKGYNNICECGNFIANYWDKKNKGYLCERCYDRLWSLRQWIERLKNYKKN